MLYYTVIFYVVQIYLFPRHNGATSSSDYIASNSRMSNVQLNDEDVEGSSFGLI